MFQSIANRVRQFHNDDRGNVSLESIAVLAVGALVLGGVMFLWNSASINGQSGGIGKAVSELVGTLFKTVAKW